MGSHRSKASPCNSKLLLLVALFACTLGSLPSAVHAHASLQTPTSRNAVYFTSSGSLPGQGLGAWYANGGNGLGPTPFRPAGSPGVCGDPYQESPWTNIANFMGGPVTTYTSGQTIRVNVRLQVNHGGRLTFRICDRRTSLDQSCFNAPGRTLLRADNGKPHWYILSGSWANTNAGNPEFAVIDYRLPSGFSCPNGCVLQMEYFTYNTCLEQCPREDCGFYADRRNAITGQAGPLAFCYTPGANAPEIFLNCADIVINGGGGGGTVPPPSPPTNTCGKCNLPAMSGGCKCDSNCNCLPGTGGARCDKCNIPVAQGGCQCNSNCDCITSGCSTNCPTVTNSQCQSGGGCNTATRTCNAITNRADGTTCTGGTCRGGVCQTSSTGGSCSGLTGQAMATCFCGRNPIGYYQDTANACRGGIWCYAGGAQYVPCAQGTLYDANLRVCNWASQVTCPAVRTASTAASTSRTARRRASLKGDVTRTPAQTAEEAAAAAVAAAAVAAAQPAGIDNSTFTDPAAAIAASAVTDGVTQEVPAAFVAPEAIGAAGVNAAEPTAAAGVDAVGDVAATGVDGVAGVVADATDAAVVTEAGAVVADPAGATVAP